MIFFLPLMPRRAFTFASRGKSKQKRYRMLKPLKTHAAEKCAVKVPLRRAPRETRRWLKHGAAPVAKRSTLRLTFLQSPQVHNIHLCGFGVRPGRGDFKRTPININKIKIKIWDKCK